MKSRKKRLASCSMLLALGACSEAFEDSPEANDEIVRNLITAGFPKSEIELRDDGRIWVGGDAVVGLAASRELAGIREDAGEDEFRQYRTTNLASSTIDTICVDAPGWTGNMRTALDNAIANYNILNLSFNMRRTTGSTDGCDAVIQANAISGTGGAAGFPSGGLPYDEINIGTGIASVANLTHLITHELGHTIGFRHSDYYNRSISCNTGGDEGADPSGAVHIDNTPTTAVRDGSIMNACYNSGSTGAWTSSDVSANNELYGLEFFENPSLWLGNYGYDTGWRVSQHPRFVTDVNGDGRDDVVGFGNAGAYVSLSNGSSFSSPSLWVADYGYEAGGWRVERHPRMMSDVDGDGLDDIVGFSNAGVYVSRSTGSSFSAPVLWVNNYGFEAGGWQVERHPRILADVNGDGRNDVVGFGNAGAYVSLSTGSSFSSPALWVNDFGYEAGGWRVDQHPRMMADVNGDGLDDIVGFSNAGAYVALSNGSSFSSPALWVNNYGYETGGWWVDRHPRMMADVNGDGRADIVGFGNAGAYVSLSSGSGFSAPSLWVNNYGYSSGWLMDRHPRFVTDIDGDERADIVGFGDAGAYVSRSTGVGFEAPQLWGGNFGYVVGGWRVDRHPRVVGDVTGDGLKDIVGFGYAGAYAAPYRP